MGISKDVPIKVGDLHIPIDLVILEMEEDIRAPIILGKPFLATVRCRIDVKHDKLSFDVEDKHVGFKLIKASKFPSISSGCQQIDVVDNLVQGIIFNNVSNDPLEHSILNNGTSKDENPKVAICAQFLEASP